MRIQPVNVIVAGVGGQGVLLVTRVLAEAALAQGEEAVVSEVHGMAQRGGSVVATVRLGEGANPLVARREAHAVLALEPLEAHRIRDRMGPQTVVVTALRPVPPLTVGLGKEAYPRLEALFRDLTAVTPHVYALDADAVARAVGLPVAANVALLGALVGSGVLPLDPEAVRDRIRDHVPPETVRANLEAFDQGLGLVPERRLMRTFL